MRLFGLALLLAAIAWSQSTAPIPDPIAFFEQVKTHQSEMDAIRENYTFRRAMQTDDVDKNGNILRTTTSERDVFFVNGYQIGRLVKSNGRILTEGEDKKEQERVRKMVETRMKGPPRPANRAGRIGFISEILAVATISNPRRMLRNGRDTLAFDFTGDKSAHAQGTGQSIAKKLAGTIWFDEADRQVARLEVRFDDGFRFAGGLLGSIQKGTYMTFEQSPIGEGLWMQTYHEQHIAARILIKGIHENQQVRNSDFRRFNVDTVEQISPPSAK